MIRILEDRILAGDVHYIEGACVDADVSDLPTAGIATGSQMICADSGDVYLFAEGDSPAWPKIGSNAVS